MSQVLFRQHNSETLETSTYIYICSLRRKAILYSRIPDRIWLRFSTQVWYTFLQNNEYPFLNEIMLEVFVQKYNLYLTVVKNGPYILNFEREQRLLDHLL